MTSIVIVEDNAGVAEMLSAFSSLRYDDLEVVAVFASVAAAQAWDGWDDVDGALVDWMMPLANGGAMLDWLAVHAPHVACHIMTAATPMPTHPHAVAVWPKARFEFALEALRGPGQR